MTASKIIAAFLLLCVLGSGPVLGQVSCPGDFSAIDGKCFQFVAEEMVWAQAYSYCQDLGGNLAILDECSLWVAVVKEIEKLGLDPRLTPGFWVGATDLQREGDWLWVNGENVQMGIPFWGWTEEFPEPDGGENSNCAYMRAGDQYKFHDGTCISYRLSVCQVEPTEEYLQE